MGDMQAQPRGRSYFADRQAAERAVAIALPMLENALLDSTIGESGFLYIVIMDPVSSPAVDEFENAILFEYAVGDRALWDADYAGFARAKAQVSWRTGMNGHAVRQIAPHLLQRSDCGIWGAVWIDGIVVGVSGANPWYDEAFAGAIAHCFKAVAKGRALAVPEAPSLEPGGREPYSSDQKIVDSAGVTTSQQG